MAHLLGLPVEIRQHILAYIIATPLPSCQGLARLTTPYGKCFPIIPQQHKFLLNYGESASTAYLGLLHINRQIRMEMPHVLKIRSQQLSRLWKDLARYELFESCTYYGEPDESEQEMRDTALVYLGMLIKESLAFCNYGTDWSDAAITTLYLAWKLSEHEDTRFNDKDIEGSEEDVSNSEVEDLVQDALPDLKWRPCDLEATGAAVQEAAASNELQDTSSDMSLD